MASKEISHTKYPKISIVTPTYNQSLFIEETIKSVIQQSYPNLEYIIIDGGSTDGTVDIIKKYEKHLKFWISEKDKGQANAINKGLQHCTGEIFNWLNSDDYLEAGALQKIADAFQDRTVQMVAGKVRRFYRDKEEFISNQLLSAKGLMCWEPGVQFVQPGVWMRRDLVEQAGGIDEQFHYAFDWDLYIRYLYHFPKVKEVPELLVHFRLHDASKTHKFADRFHVEERLVIEKLGELPVYIALKKVCDYKTQKSKWTAFLSKQSKASYSALRKCTVVLREMNKYHRVSFSRQTAGAFRAFFQKRII
ncbi:MAG: glycosyltransferase [Chitinophagaceae bacterium]|nr:MAG: glycosyltransferase [Chitinophagaceae bacterium]